MSVADRSKSVPHRILTNMRSPAPDRGSYPLARPRPVSTSLRPLRCSRAAEDAAGASNSSPPSLAG